MPRQLLVVLLLTWVTLACYDPRVIPGADAGVEDAALLGDAAIGASCGAHEHCASGLCILPIDADGLGTGWTAGTCTRSCPLEGCGVDQACVRIVSQPLCLASCLPGAAACRQGYVCSPPHGACLPDCNAGAPCPPGASCQTSGLCGPG